MATQTRNFNNISGTPQLSAAVASTDTSLTLTTTAASFPVAPFTIAIDQGLANEEIILVGVVTGSTLSALTRGFDGTAAQSHGAGANVTHVAAAEAFNKSYRHMDGVDAAHGVGTIVGTAEPQALTNKTVAGAFTGTASSTQTPSGSAGFAFTQDAAGRAGVRVVNTVGAGAAHPIEVTNGSTTLFSVDAVGAVAAPSVAVTGAVTAGSSTVTTTTATTSHLGAADASSLAATGTVSAGALSTSGNLTVSGSATVTGSATVSGSGTVTGALTVGSETVNGGMTFPDRGTTAAVRLDFTQGPTDTGNPMAVTGPDGPRFLVTSTGVVSSAARAVNTDEHLRINGNSLRQFAKKLQVLDTSVAKWAPVAPAAAIDLTRATTFSGFTGTAAIGWDSKANDVESLYTWSAGTPTNLQVPFTGRYVLNATMVAILSDATSANISIKKNGTTMPDTGRAAQTNAVNQGANLATGTEVVLAAGDVLAVWVSITSGTASIQSTTQFQPKFSCRFVGWS